MSRKLRKYRIGLDPGNSETTLVALTGKGSRTHRTYPSMIGRGSSANLLRLRGAGRSMAGGIRPGEKILQLDGVEYFGGDLALSGQATNPTTGRGDVGRYSGGHSLRLLLMGVGELLEAGELQDTPELYVATGVPVDVWSDELVQAVRQGLCGEWAFSYNGVERLAVVKGVFVTMEGSGALIHLGEGGEDDEQGVADLGGGSLDLFYARGLDPIMPRCGSFPHGVEAVGQLLNEQLRERYDHELRGDRLRAVLYAKAHGLPLPEITARTRSGQRTITINGELDHAIAAVGSDVQTAIGIKWSDERDQIATSAAGLYATGGGVYLFRDLIEAKVGPVTVSAAPERDNAEGYADLAASLTYDEWADFAA